MKLRINLMFVLILVITLNACGTAEPPGPTVTPTLVPTVTNTPLPTETPTPEPTPTPEITQEELKAIYQPLIGNGLLMYGVCPMIVDTAERLQSGELDGFGAFGEMIAEGLFIEAIDENLGQSTATGEIGEMVERLQTQTDEMKVVLGDWYNKNISSADVPGLLEDTCPGIEDALEEIVEAARAEGMTQETIDLIVAEFQEAMDEMGESLENN